MDRKIKVENINDQLEKCDLLPNIEDKNQQPASDEAYFFQINEIKMESEDLDSEYELLDIETEQIYDQFDHVAETTDSPCRGRERKDLKFVQILQSVGKVLLDKSQTPPIKMKKKIAAKKMCELLMNETEDSYTVDQVVKKVANMKQRIKRITDMKRTGNVPIALKDFEKLFLDLLPAEDNPNIAPLKCEFELGTSHSKSRKSPEGKSSDETNATVFVLHQEPVMPTISSEKRKRSLSETKTTSSENNELQRTVLEKQLKLINIQKEMFIAQEKRQQQLHNKQMEVLALKKRVLTLKLCAFEKKSKS